MKNLVEILTADRAGSCRIARATIQPALWSQLLENVPEVADAWRGSGESFLSEKSGLEDFPRMELMGVRLEIDERQPSPYRLWDADGNEVAGE